MIIRLLTTLIVMLATAFIALNSIWAPERQVFVQAELFQDKSLSELSFPLNSLNQPVELDFNNWDHIRLHMDAPGFHIKGRIEVDFESLRPLEDGTRSQLKITSDAKADRENRKNCEVSPCIARIDVSDRNVRDVRLSVKNGGAIEISAIRYRAVTGKRESHAGSTNIIYLYLVLLLVGPFIATASRLPALGEKRGAQIELIALTFMGSSWLLFVGWLSAGVAFGYITLAWGLVVLCTGIAKRENGKTGRWAMVSICLLILGLLGIKFIFPLMAQAFANPGGFNLLLPLGISYFAIRLIDLFLSIGSGHIIHVRPLAFFAFLISPYTLPAGPIQTFDGFEKGRLENFSVTDVGAGSARFLVGSVKKIVADAFFLAVVAQGMSEIILNGAQVDPEKIALMLLANLVYIFLDFSGYSDMAIGASRAAGRKLPENFAAPLIQPGVQVYWRTWHMSLSNWVMRRVYFPAFLATRNRALSIFLAMFTIGMWHAPTLSWGAWALWHSAAQLVETPLKGLSSYLQSFLQTPWRAPTQIIQTSVKVIAYVIGVGLMLVTVSMGHAFTLFSSLDFALLAFEKGIVGFAQLFLPPWGR